MAYNARKIVNDVFTANGIPLLFAWYNDMCVAHDGPGRPSYLSAAAAGAAAAAAAWRQPVEKSNLKEHSTVTDLTQHIPPDTSSSLPSTTDSSTPNEDKEALPRTVMLKPLTFVWQSYPSYSELNTVTLHT